MSEMIIPKHVLPVKQKPTRGVCSMEIISYIPADKYKCGFGCESIRYGSLLLIIIPRIRSGCRIKSHQTGVFKGGNTILYTLPELLISIGGIPGRVPDIAGHLSAGRTGGVAMLVDAAGEDGAGFSFPAVEHLAAGFIAAGAHVSVERAGGTVRSASGKPQDLPLLRLAEILQDQLIGPIQPVLQQVVRDLPVSLDGIPVLFVAVVSGNDISILLPHEFAFRRLQFEVDIVRLVIVIQQDGGEHLSADMVPDPVPLRLEVLCHAAFGHQIFINPGIFHIRILLSSSHGKDNTINMTSACHV